MLNKTELETAIKVSKHEIMKLTHESLRPNQGFKMRTVGAQIAAIVTALEYYEVELKKLNTPVKAVKLPAKVKED